MLQDRDSLRARARINDPHSYLADDKSCAVVVRFTFVDLFSFLIDWDEIMAK